jgi:23S rRNA (cytosine1962-C5)-methyltransferase
MSYKRVFLNPHKEESLKRFHQWVFSGAIHHIDGIPEEGEIVEVYDSQGQFLAVGHCQIGSIAVRILSFQQETINLDFWKRQFGSAYALRRQLGLTNRPDNDVFRLIHGEGDCLPGLIVDVYGNTAVVQAHSPGMHIARNELAVALKDLPDGLIQNIYYKSEGTLPFKADLDAEDGYLYSSAAVPEFIVENGLKFKVDWMKGQKTGFFVDQRDNRSLLEKYAGSRNILNLFCYTGGFSAYAMRGKANLIHSVDSSSKAIDLTKENIALNFPDSNRHQAFTDDAFRYLEKTDIPYDLIVLDPPAFAKHRKVLKNALQGYKRLNALAFKKIQPRGIIFTFSCSQTITKDEFRLAVFSAAAQAGRNVKILQQLTQQSDHPINIYHPESEYIKGLVLFVE